MRPLGVVRFLPISQRTIFTFAICLALAGVCFAASAASGGNEANSSGPSAYSYVGSYNPQTAGSLVYGFAVASDGSAQAIAGSPFSGAASSDMVVTPSNLFAGQGSNIATYTIAPDGALQQTSVMDGVVGNPSSGGMTVGTLSLNPNDQTLYASIVCGSCNNYYAQWAIGSGGQLMYVSDSSPFATLSGAWGWQPLTFSLDDRYAYTATVCRFDGEVAGFARHPDGSLSYFQPNAQPPSLNGAGGGVGCSENMAASNAGYMAIAWTGSYCCNYPGTVVGSYRFNSDGTLALVQGPPIIPSVTNEYSMAFDPTGTYLAVAGSTGSQNNLQAAIQIYKLGADGKLTVAGPLLQVPGVAGFQIVSWDKQNHVYALPPPTQTCSDNTCAVYIFNANSGVLTAAPGSPHPVPDPVSLAVLPIS